ncbi:aspartyl/asparaginyl beta-hydroxylase domain-containing protein [Xanthomonas albilineans]|uniref:aspartyl/asparaginyl beta-hydroxylase domain-containing protein n=1 Tax=Xanthomonas albilineans TaxID=29447 RepID=UPI0009BBD683|nr:aspartyl/asparaginyl beta-hydroxylase domain-containing protein [Xanthomonas albilineans]
MNISLIAGFLLILYAAGSISYVFAFRGKKRYSTFSQYMRKSWPIFAPFNCLLYMATRKHAKGPVIDASYLKNIALLRSQWHVIRAEAISLHQSGQLRETSQPGSTGFHDLGFRTFYKHGWMKFYLKWYGKTHRSAIRLCPETTRILEQLPWIHGAMFSILPPGAELSLHSDPLACSLRYHLGLKTPNSDNCKIIIDGRTMAWRDGQDFVFDETYPHSAINASDQDRVILMCDVERPMHLTGRLINHLYMLIARGMLVPNTSEDEKGAISRLFELIDPVRQAGTELKRRKRIIYKFIKHTLNFGLLGLLLYVTYLAMRSLEIAISAAFT